MRDYYITVEKFNFLQICLEGRSLNKMFPSIRLELKDNKKTQITIFNKPVRIYMH